MKILKYLFTCLMWAFLAITVLFVYCYDEMLYSVLIMTSTVGLTVYYRKFIKELYLEVFEELGMTKYYQRIKAKIKTFDILHKQLYGVMNKLGLW